MRWRKRDEPRATTGDLAVLGLTLTSMDEKLNRILAEVRDGGGWEEERKSNDLETRRRWARSRRELEQWLARRQAEAARLAIEQERRQSRLRRLTFGPIGR